MDCLQKGRKSMTEATYPAGITEHAALNVPHLGDLNATPPGVPIPYPNNPHFAPGNPSLVVIDALFEPVITIDALGAARATDLFLI
jgi:hypothetical protein